MEHTATATLSAKKLREAEANIAHQEVTPLKWPDGFGRTLIGDRRSQKAWKKPFAVYANGVIEELKRFGAQAVTITRNKLEDEKYDPAWRSGFR